ncbi:hydroperoxide isomerase ALOXE3-like [Centropristis striata]|uniref:hydroperoxide isomerase ALOXE3-like n=1 Tax=Centropristis striata TaxID=184440 RepID=UPI0027E0EF76|nr:hydroperoxide isomerase ALOXE3-like [Centropristis striata]
MVNYKVTVSTGNLSCVTTFSNVFIKLVGTDGVSEHKWLMGLKGTSSFMQGVVSSFYVCCPASLGKLVLIELDKQRLPLFPEDSWFPTKVEVNSPEGDTYNFPIYRWITDSEVHRFREGTALTVFEDSHHLGRYSQQQELIQREKDYCLADDMQKDNIFLCDYKCLDGLKANTINRKKQYLMAPLVLLHKSPDDKLMPIAIQYDYGGTPLTLQLPPPTTKGTTSEATMLQTFPDVNTTVQGMSTMWLPSKQSSDFVALGQYPEDHFSEEVPCKLIKAFQGELQVLSAVIKARNKSLEVPYTYMDPTEVENSVAI